MTQGVQFVFSPATFPRSTMENKMVFCHGTIIEWKTRNGEVTFRVKDEKGEWEGFIEERKTLELSENTNVRAYGMISPQPDGRNVLACAWVKVISDEEKQFCERKTRETWEKLTQENVKLLELTPFVRPPPKLVKVEEKIPLKTGTTNVDFISAAEINVEREYL
jgi:hypothetical protein